MKKTYFCLILFLLSNTIWSQEVDATSKETNNDIASFETIEEPVLFPGCENINKRESFKCFQDKMNQHIKNNFRYPQKAMNNNIQGKVIVTYIIDKDGEITNITTTGADAILQKEAKRIISLLPKMTPGKQKGIPVKVRHVVPITFKIR